MKYPQNLHTHSTYCDGKNTFEETVARAIELGFTGIGFSSHAPMTPPIPCDYTMSPLDTEKYKAELAALKQKYEGQIDVFAGIEYDTRSCIDLNGFDYIIGSVHYVERGGEVVDFDLDANSLKKLIDEKYSGDGMALATDYYEELSRMPEIIVPDIVGHFDIVAKQCEKYPFFDIESKKYKDMALSALHALAPSCKLYELNTGCIPRGYRTTPYPPRFILEEMNKLGLGVVISSDCHNIDYLNYGFDDALRLIESCGFKEVYILTKNGFEGISLKSIDK